MLLMYLYIFIFSERKPVKNVNITFNMLQLRRTEEEYFKARICLIRGCVSFWFTSGKLYQPISQLPDVAEKPFSTQNHRLDLLSAHKHHTAHGEA